MLFNKASQNNNWAKSHFTEALRCTFAAWCMAYYLLPNTFWARTSPGTYIIRSSVNISYQASIIYSVLFSFIGMGCWLYFGIICKERKNTYPTYIFVLLSIYLLPHWIALLMYCSKLNYFNVDQAMSIASLVSGITTGLICVIIAGTVYRIALVMCILGIVQGTYTLYYHKIGINNLLSGEVLRAGGTFNHPYGVYTVMLLVFPIAVGLLVAESRFSLKLLFSLSASVTLGALIVTFYRGGMLALAVAIIWFSYVSFKNHRITLAVALFLTVASTLVFVHRTNGTINAASSERSVAGHYRFWKVGWSVFKEHWIVGVGPGATNINVHLPINAQAGSLYGLDQQTLVPQPQNVLLHWMDEMGIGGGILFVLFIFVIGSAIKQNLDDPVALGFGAAWLALLIAGMFDILFGIGDRYYGNVLVGALIGTTSLLGRVQFSSQSLLALEGETKNDQEHVVASA